MYTDRLRQTLQEIEQHCAANKIPLFYGGVETKAKRTAVWEPEDPGDWKTYLSLLTSLSTKMLHVQTITSEVSDAEETASLLAYGNTLEGPARAEWQASYDITEQTKGFLLDITLIFFHEGLACQWSGGVDWEEHYDRIQPVRSEQPLSREEAQDPEQKAREEAEKKTERDRLFEEEARRLLTNELYLSFPKTNDRRGFVFQTLWEKYPDREELFRIATKAEERYKKEVLEKQEAAIVEKLKEMRRQNPKLTKTVAAGMLKLTDRQVGQYWYQT